MSASMPKVLLVEDEDEGRAILAAVLAETGYPVIEAEGYRAALERMAADPAAIAIVDLRLPDGDGLALMHELRAQYPNLIILISTGHGTMQAAIRALNEGAYAYLQKPYQAETLLSDLRRASETLRLERENRTLLRQSQAVAARVTALLDASEEINTTTVDVQVTMRRIVQTAVRIMAARVGFIGLVEEGALRVREWWDGAVWHSLQRTFAEGEAGPGHVWKTGRTYRSDDAPNDPLLRGPFSHTLGQRTMICSPILTRHGGFLGILDLSDRNGGQPFSDEDALFLAGLCRHVAVALENARLYEEQQRSLEQRKRFYREVVAAATQNKLILCDVAEMPEPVGPPEFTFRVTRPEEISEVRYRIGEAVRARTDMADARMEDLLLCAGEATTNAYKHGGGGDVALWVVEDRLLLRVEDRGPGIDETTLPRAALVAGFSTKASLGMGMTIILNFMDQVLLSTDPNGTRLDMYVAIAPRPVDPFEQFGFLPEL